VALTGKSFHEALHGSALLTWHEHACPLAANYGHSQVHVTSTIACSCADAEDAITCGQDHHLQRQPTEIPTEAVTD
jgi:hypothetical protein